MIAGIIQARMGSSRLPGKVLELIEDKTLIEHIVLRLKKCVLLEKVIVATSTSEKDDALIAFLEKKGIDYCRGSEENVVERISQCAEENNIDILVRVTGDDPLIDPGNIDTMIKTLLEKDADLVYTKDMPLGTGLGMIVVKHSALKIARNEAVIPIHKEDADEFILDNPQRFKIIKLPCEEKFNLNCRLTVDTAEDLEFMRNVYSRLYVPGEIVDLEKVLQLLRTEPELVKINAHVPQRGIQR